MASAKNIQTDTANCPCGSGRDFHACCDPYLQGEPVPNAETLLRARFSAYATANERYINQTWHPASRPIKLHLHNAEQVRWYGLKIIRIENGGPDDQAGLVEFSAHYQIKHRQGQLHEISHFARDNGKWYYLEGEITDIR